MVSGLQKFIDPEGWQTLFCVRSKSCKVASEVVARYYWSYVKEIKSKSSFFVFNIHTIKIPGI